MTSGAAAPKTSGRGRSQSVHAITMACGCFVGAAPRERGVRGSRLFLRLRPCSKARCRQCCRYPLPLWTIITSLLMLVHLGQKSVIIRTFLAFSAVFSKLFKTVSAAFLVCLLAAFLLAAAATSSRESWELEPLRELFTALGRGRSSWARPFNCKQHSFSITLS